MQANVHLMCMVSHTALKYHDGFFFFFLLHSDLSFKCISEYVAQTLNQIQPLCAQVL